MSTSWRPEKRDEIGGYLLFDLAGTNVGFTPCDEGRVTILIRADDHADIQFDLTYEAIQGLQGFLDMATRKQRTIALEAAEKVHVAERAQEEAKAAAVTGATVAANRDASDGT